MTEQAASKVLNATDIAKPIQDKLQAAPRACAPAGTASTPTSSARTSSVPWPARPASSWAVSSTTRETNAQLLEIMMAQDFQDLTGQVIKKVVDLAQGLEQLLQVLIEAMPAERKAEASESP
jgi:chemotaxis protein CheZ